MSLAKSQLVTESYHRAPHFDPATVDHRLRREIVFAVRFKSFEVACDRACDLPLGRTNSVVYLQLLPKLLFGTFKFIHPISLTSAESEPECLDWDLLSLMRRVNS